MIKNTQQSKNRSELPQSGKGIHEKSTANIILNDEKPNASLLKSGTEIEYSLLPLTL